MVHTLFPELDLNCYWNIEMNKKVIIFLFLHIDKPYLADQYFYYLLLKFFGEYFLLFSFYFVYLN